MRPVFAVVIVFVVGVLNAGTTLPGFAGCPATSPAPPDSLIPLDLLIGPPQVTAPQLSPDGAQIAYIAPLDGVPNLWVGPAEDPGKARPVTRQKRRGIQPTDVSGNVLYRWTGDGSRLIVPKDNDGDERWQLYAVDVRTGEEKALTQVKSGQVRILAMHESHPHEALLQINDRDASHFDVYRLDFETGALTLVERNDRFKGLRGDNDLQLRIAAEYDSTGGYQAYRRTPAGAWEPFRYVPMDDTYNRSIGFDGTNRLLYAYDSKGRNTAALTAWSLDTGKPTVLAEDPRVDIDGVLIEPRTRRIQAYATTFLRREWHALDPAIRGDLERLRRADPGDFTVESRSRDDRRWIVRYAHDDAPAVYKLYQRPAGTLTRLFSERPDLEKLSLVGTHPVVVKSRDGFDLVSYVWLPRASDPDGDGRPAQALPMVMIVHGGPGDERAEYGFAGLIQWLVNRGYAVFNVNFRGSPGFGKKFLNAEQLEWGGKMQDDLVDQARWAVEQGIARKDGIAIMGGSYGGYATLCGMTFAPDVFACGVDVVGPADLESFMNTIPREWSLDHFAKRVGDPRTEAGRAHLRSRSPIRFVDRVRGPLLIAQGAHDARVAQAESDRMAHALDSLGVAVTYLLYPDEGHGFHRPENSRAFYAITELFLARCLGGRAEPLGDRLRGSSVTVPIGAARVPGLEAAVRLAGSPGAPVSR